MCSFREMRLGIAPGGKLLEWVMLILIIAFILWAVQIVAVYRRQGEKMEAHIQMAQTNQQDIAVQTEQYEERLEELSVVLDELKNKMDGLGKTERGLEQEVAQYQRQENQRRPTRHSVDPDPNV